MTILYKLFGIPRTFDEFVDKVKQKGQKDVNVVLGRYCHKAVDYADDRKFYVHHYFIELNSGKIMVKLDDIPVSSTFTRDHTETEQEIKSLAEKAVNKLKELGLEAKLMRIK